MTDNRNEQTEKFKELARELECDEDEAAFEEKVRKVAKPTEGGPTPSPARRPTENGD
jgi:hypothetical protein